MFNNNPVPVIEKHCHPHINSICNPDPYMIRHEGVYYCYTTGYNGVNVLRSDQLDAFEHMGYALSDDAWVSYWAPAVLFFDGMFYMYYSSIPKGETDDHRHYLQVAVSNSPLGPFKYEKTLYDTFSIDPHVVEKDGSLYLFYAANMATSDKIGTVIMLDKLADPLTPQNKPCVVLSPTIDQEIFATDRFGDGKDWYTLEGPFYFEQAGTGYLMYSGNAYTHEDYFVNYATCDASLPLEEAVFTKYPDDQSYHPLLGKDAYFTGCGHNAVIADTQGQLYTVYHGRRRTADEAPSDLDDGRRLCISALEINGDQLILRERR